MTRYSSSPARSLGLMLLLLSLVLCATLAPAVPSIVATAAPQRTPLAATGAAGSTTTYVPLVATFPTSDALIDAALQRGELTAETALIYHVYVLFGDRRLPAQYK